jgi:alpha-galactosidase
MHGHLVRIKTYKALVVCLGFLLPSGLVWARGHQAPLALTPPMGWNDWYRFGCKVNESEIRAAADAIVSSGMKAAGYEYVNVDDCWQGHRDKRGFIYPNSRFPDIEGLADYIHSKGLKFGLYSSPRAQDLRRL